MSHQHHNEEAYVGALALTIAVRSLAFDQSTPNDLCKTVLSELPDSRVRDRILALSALPDDLTAVEIGERFGTSGYVVDSVPLALFAARHADRISFESTIRGAIEAGGDTDTIASMTGQIAGAWVGVSEIPRTLIERLPEASSIERIALKFAMTV